MDDIIKACLRIIFKAPECLDEDLARNIDIVAYHEAGHAVVNEILEPGSVNLVTLSKHQSDIGGITSCTNDEEYFFKKKFMENRVICLLAGKAGGKCMTANELQSNSRAL